jgi:hypothetical protein
MVNNGKNLRYEVVGDVLTIFKNPNAEGTGFKMANNFDFGDDIKYIDIQDGVTSIGDNAFAGFTALTSVIIPASVTSIGANAFNGCSALAEVLVMPVTPPTLGSDAFTGIVNNAVFTVRNASYEENDDWKPIKEHTGNYDYDGCNFTMSVMSCVDIAYIDVEGQPAECPVATPITSNANVTFSFGGDVWYVVSGNVTIGGELKFNNTTGSTNIILCDGATLTVGSMSVSNNLNIFVQTNGTGAITANSTVDNGKAISVNKNLTINGGKITATATGEEGYGIYSSEGYITINGGTIVVNANKEGVYAYIGNFTINGGDFTVNNAKYGIDAGKNLIVNDGKFTLTKSCFYAYKNLTVNKGNITINTDGKYGCEVDDGDLTINGGEITINGNREETKALYSYSYVFINGGKINITDAKFGIYSSFDNLAINGGEITIKDTPCGVWCYYSFSMDDGTLTITDTDESNHYTEDGICAYNGQFFINGGTITVSNATEYGFYAELSLDIYGGKVVANGDVAGILVKDHKTFTLGWTNFGDYLYANSYKLGTGAKMVIADGQEFTYGDGTASLVGNVTDQADVIAGKYLLPVVDNFNMKANAQDGSYWTSFYSGVSSYSVGAGVTIYKAAIDGNHVTLTPVEGGIIPAGEAVILKATAAPIAMTLTTAAPAADAYDDNELKGADYDTPQAANTTYYVLSKVGDNFGFYKLADTKKLGAGKAFLKVENPGAAPVFYDFEFEEPTAIEDHELNELSDTWYTINGVKLEGKPTEKGIYLYNGRKVVIK